jgi:hypothetical protein
LGIAKKGENFILAKIFRIKQKKEQLPRYSGFEPVEGRSFALRGDATNHSAMEGLRHGNKISVLLVYKTKYFS